MQRTSEQILAELETLRTQLDLILGTNPGVVDQYERRKAEVSVYFDAQTMEVLGWVLIAFLGVILDRFVDEEDRGA